MNLKIIRDEILNPDKGFYVIRKLYSEEEIDHYRENCLDLIKKGPVINKRINIKNMFDYVHKRSFDQNERTTRVYQFFENHKYSKTGFFFEKSKKIMDLIEDEWSKENKYYDEYRKTLQNYIIFTWYKPGFGKLPIHQDIKVQLKFPLLQSNVMLTQYNKDYYGGDFIFYSKNNKKYSVNNDLKLKKGDVLVFDKSLFHEVTKVESHSSILSRCTVLINARAKFKKEKLLFEKIKTNKIFNFLYSKISKNYKRDYN